MARLRLSLVFYLMVIAPTLIEFGRRWDP